MVLNNSPSVLIVTASAQRTLPLDDLIAHCDWPLVVKADPCRLATELSLRTPECLLFWLEEEQRSSETARLISWLKERSQRPYRLAVAYRMVADVEALLRVAGAHAFLNVADNVVGRVTGVVESLIGETSTIETAPKSTATANEAAAHTIETLAHLVQPP